MEWHIFICIILKHNLKSCTIIKNLQSKEIYLYSSCINKVKYTESNELRGNIHTLPLDTRHSVQLLAIQRQVWSVFISSSIVLHLTFLYSLLRGQQEDCFHREKTGFSNIKCLLNSFVYYSPVLIRFVHNF